MFKCWSLLQDESNGTTAQMEVDDSEDEGLEEVTLLNVNT